MLNVPSRWTTNVDNVEGAHHPYKTLAWKLQDRQDVIEGMTGEQQDVIHDIIDELEVIEKSSLIERQVMRTTRRAKILNAKPLKENDERLKEAYHIALLNRQMTMEDMPYDTFKLLYDDIIHIIKTK